MLCVCLTDAANTTNNNAKVWAAEGEGRELGKLVRTLSGHGHRINTLALSCEYVCRTGYFDHSGRHIADAEEVNSVAYLVRAVSRHLLAFLTAYAPPFLLSHRLAAPVGARGGPGTLRQERRGLERRGGAACFGLGRLHPYDLEPDRGQEAARPANWPPASECVGA